MRRLCDEKECLILDEVQTGLRTLKLSATEHPDYVRGDIYVFAKAVSGESCLFLLYLQELVLWEKWDQVQKDQRLLLTI